MNLLCSIGTKCCFDFIDYTKQVGIFISWQEAISIGGIIFAASQFMEAVKIRNYIYKFGRLHTLVPILVGISIVGVIISNLVQLTGTRIPVISYPATYELISLTSLSVLLLSFVVFFLRPKKFITFNVDLLDNIGRELLYNQSDENLLALSRIINGHLEEIIKSASNAKRDVYLTGREEIKKIDLRSIQFIDEDLSTPNFVTHIANNNIGFTVRFFKLAEEYKLWESGGSIFVDRLTETLFSDEKSLLTKELMFGGVSGLQKPITNTLFHSNQLLAHYRLINVNGFWSSEISITSLQNWTHALEASLRNYFVSERNIYYTGTPNDSISYSLEKLGECTRSIVLKINRLNEDDIWDNEYGSKVSTIGGLFEKLEHILVKDDAENEDKPVFSEDELKAEKRTVSEGIAKGFFAYLEGLVLMDNEERARMDAMIPYWVLFDGSANPILKAVRGKVLELVKERVSENLKKRYASMIKLMLVIYDGSLKRADRGNEIMDFMGELFRTELAFKIITDKSFREKHMPSHWYISKGGKSIYRRIHGNTELLFTLKNNKTAK